MPNEGTPSTPSYARHLILTVRQHDTLTHLLRQMSLPLSLHQRVRIVLLRAEGYTLAAIGARVGRTRQHVAHWLRQWEADGLEGLENGPGLSTVLRQRRSQPTLPLPQRICGVLARLRKDPKALHYREIAKRLEEPDAMRVWRVCNRLAHTGRLAWVDMGTYRCRDPVMGGHRS